MRFMVGVVAGLALTTLVAGAKDPQAGKGYLKPGDIDVMAVLPRAPVAGEARYEADREIFRSTRKLSGTARWAMATKDVSWQDADMLTDFSCALGTTLTPKDVPHLMTLLRKAGWDTQKQSQIAKQANKRQRPFLIDSGETCESQADLAKSYDYPSGHTTGGWTWALVLADVVPERATAILERGRAYGESRIVCGAHNASAVEGGRLSATVTMTAVRSTATYKRDLKAAQTEFKVLKKTPPAAAVCDAEKGLMSLNVFAPAN